MLIGLRQRGQPHPWLCTSLAHDSQKRHQHDACITRCHETHLAEVNTAADTVVGVPASSLVSSSFWCCVLSSGASVSSSASEWLSLNIFSEPTAWLTAQTAVACTHGCQISAKHIFMRLMARPRLTLLTSDTLSMVSSNVNRPTRLWVAFFKNYARKPRQPYFVWCFRVFFLMAFHTLSLLRFHSCIFHPCDMLPHFPLPHFQRPHLANWLAAKTPLRIL